MVHNRPDGTARKRFNDNKDRFTEGIDFFRVRYDECIDSPLGGRSIFDVVLNQPSEIRTLAQKSAQMTRFFRNFRGTLQK